MSANTTVAVSTSPTTSAHHSPAEDATGHEALVKSSPMTVITPIPRWLCWPTRIILLFLLIFSPLREVDRLQFIHFARWQVLRSKRTFRRLHWNQPARPLKYDYFLFSTNFNGSWDQYIDAFSFICKVALGVNVLWGTSKGFPGTRALRNFKRYIRYHEIPTQAYYDAYPEASVRDITAAKAVHEALDDFRERVRAIDQPERFASEYQRFLDSVARHLGCIGRNDEVARQLVKQQAAPRGLGL